MAGTVVVQSSAMAPSSVPPRPRPARHPRPRLLGGRRLAASVGAAALVAVLVAGCSSSSDDEAGPATLIDGTVVTAEPATTVAPPSSTSAPGTTADQPSSPSSLPADLSGTCALLAETYGLDDLRPKDSESWPDERQRVVVDARREADLLTAAAAAAPPAIAADITVLAGHATFVADAVEPAPDHAAALAALDAEPAPGPVEASAAAVTAWRDANC
jgi:hypothetical protein